MSPPRSNPLTEEGVPGRPGKEEGRVRLGSRSAANQRWVRRALLAVLAMASAFWLVLLAGQREGLPWWALLAAVVQGGLVALAVRAERRDAAAVRTAVASGLDQFLADRRAPGGEDPWIAGLLGRFGQAQARLIEERRDGEARRLSAELSLDRVKSVLESLGEGVAVVDGQGEVVLTNEALEEALQSPRHSPQGSPLWEVLLPELALRVREAWWRLRDAPVPDREVRLLGIECGARIYDLTAVPVCSRRSGEDFGTVFLLVDSTRAHDVGRLKDQFLSCLSHELRTPLTNICAYSEILQHVMPGESVEWPEFIKVIHEEGMRLGRLVDSLFDFLQLERGDAVFRNQEISVADVARTMVQALADRARQTQVRLVWTVEGDPPSVIADPDRLRQVITNLMDNALKFAPPEGCVRVTVGEVDGNCVLEVEDSGPGIPAAERRNVFQKFHQVADGLTQKPSGVGLGLATCRAIVGRFGGTIACEGSPLGGAAITVTLPPVAHDPRSSAALASHSGAG